MAMLVLKYPVSCPPANPDPTTDLTVCIRWIQQSMHTYAMLLAKMSAINL